MPETMTNTRKIAHIAILSTLSFLLMYLQFPLIPSASFLQFDFSILPVLIGLVMIDLQSALGILILRTLLKLMLKDRKSTRLNSSHTEQSRMPSSA